MSDSLVLKGVKDVQKHKGTEMLLMRPKRGGDTHQIKKWWAMNAKSAIYVGCSVFKVTGAAGDVYLALDTNEMSTIRIDHDGSYGFNFYGISQLSRAALFTDSWELIEHYMFPKIAKGPITTVTPPGAGVRPTSFVAPSQDPEPEPEPAPEPEPTFNELVAAADLSYAVTVVSVDDGYSSSNKYALNGDTQASISMSAGQSVHFDMSDASTSGHPIAIYTDASKTTTVTVGINTDADSNDLIFTPPIAGTFSYQCTQHADMGGTITVN